ncbi:MAG: hypothetical protein K1Y36_20075 [Blastocatellia bacterium]|nr:hypothetical protein [Blastocatellia bacterium]
MIRINLTPPNTPEWNDWQDECAREQKVHNAAVEDWFRKWAQLPMPHDQKAKEKEKPDVKNDVYQRLKESFYMALNGPFHGKCAYCESFVYPLSPGDIEHYRPKKAVKKLDKTSVTVTLNQIRMEHPGYYWLVYDWRNLMTSCELCNRPTKERAGGVNIGKHDFFPVGNDYYAIVPGEEVNEQPLLLNPLFEEPDQHLELDGRTGVLSAKTQRGQTCIDLLGLNLRHLPDERKKVFEETKTKFFRIIPLLLDDPNSQACRTFLQELQEIKAGHYPYTMAARLAIKHVSAVLGDFLDRIL